MTYSQFTDTFQKQTTQLPYEKSLSFAIEISKLLYPEYAAFFHVHKWGNPQILQEAILLCDQSSLAPIDPVHHKKMKEKVETITPDMDDFGDYLGSYALNACIAVNYSLQFLIDKDPTYIYYIGTCYTDTVDFKIQEEKALTQEQIANHPEMIKAWNFIIESTHL